jgi:hypothetical protein
MEKSSEEWDKWDYTNKLILFPNLAHIQGFPKHENISNGEFDVHFNEKSVQIAPHETDIYFIYPTNLIIACDIVEDTIFGGENVKLFRLVSNNIVLISSSAV